MLYLVTGWETHDRAGDPAVLYCGMDAGKATAAVMAAPDNFKRVENATVHFSIPQSLPAVRPPAVPAPLGAVSEEDALAMIGRIEHLEDLLCKERAAAMETLASALSEIERLKALIEAVAKSPEAPAAAEPAAPAVTESAVHETPAAEAPRAGAAESPAATKKARH